MIVPSAVSARTRMHWYGERMVKVPGELQHAWERIPTFTRCAFGRNLSLDAVVRNADDEFRYPLPVGVVSKQYVLVQHREVLAAAVNAFAECGIAPGQLQSDIVISETGARMAARIRFPGPCTFDPGDGHPIDLTFECFNSVDRTVPLFALLGWFRPVCTNGMIVGTAAARFRKKHTPALNVSDFAAVLRDGLAEAGADRDALSRWRSRQVDRAALVPWVDGAVARTWGAFAATRVYHIARTGHDGTPRDRFERVAPHDRGLEEPTVPVPGAPERSETLFDIVQVLSWIASTRANLQERVSWRAQIPALARELERAA